MNNLPLESIADNTIIIDNIPAVESIDMLTDYGIKVLIVEDVDGIHG